MDMKHLLSKLDSIGQKKTKVESTEDMKKFVSIIKDFSKPVQGVAEDLSDDVGNIYAVHPDSDESESVAILIKDVDLDEFDDLWTALPIDYLNEFGGDLPLWDSEDLALYPNIKVKAMTFDQYVDLVGDYIRSDDMANTALSKMKKGVAEGSDLNHLASISDHALDKAYGYGRSTPGNSFGWQANLKSAEFAKRMIDAGETDIEKISDAIHKGWNVTAQEFVKNPDQFDDTEKLKAAGKLEAKLQQRAKLMKINYSELPDDEKEKDRVVARALLQALKGNNKEESLGEGLSFKDYLNLVEAKKKITAKEDPCWKGYKMVGTKKKGGREVPNCVPGKKGD